MSKQLMKGNEALMKGAILAGCRAFHGYPITPASEIMEAAARLLPPIGGTFLQAESEVAAINMVYGAAAAGVRVLTASSGPGASLMQEGLSYLAGAELPCVIADITRSGPGLGNISPEQGDYFQMVKGGGHGCYRNLVLAPATVQEMADLTMLAFELAERYRNPAVVMADGWVAQMMEPVQLASIATPPSTPPWAVTGTAETRRNLIASIHLLPDEQEAYIRKLEAKYYDMQREARWEEYLTADASFVLIGYGMAGRVLRVAVDRLRSRGVRAGLLRPITLYPFPSDAIGRLCRWVESFLVVEMSTGQMLEDVRLAVNGRRPVEFFSRLGGNIASAEEIIACREEDRSWMAMF